MTNSAIATPKKRSLWSNPNFVLLFLGGLVSRIGDGIHYIGLVWYILEVSNSGLAVGTVLMFSYLPGVILGPISGVLVDRFNRKKLIISMDIIRGIIVLTMSLLIFTNTMNFTYLIIGTVLLGICISLFNPAVQASIPNIVKNEHLTQANSMQHTSNQLTGVIGPAIGGVLIVAWGIGGVFLINGITFLISALSELFIQFPTHKPQTHEVTIIQDLKEGAQFIYTKKSIFYLVLTGAFLNFVLLGTSNVALPIIVHRYLGGSVKILGITQGGLSLGGALGAIILSMIPETRNPFKTIAFGLNVQAILALIIGTITLPYFISTLGINLVLWIMLVLLILSGIIMAFVNVPVIVAFQRYIPNHVRGRAFALIGTVSGSLAPIAMGLSGMIADFILPHVLFFFRGVGSIMILFFLSKKEEVRNL